MRVLEFACIGILTLLTMFGDVTRGISSQGYFQIPTNNQILFETFSARVEI